MAAAPATFKVGKVEFGLDTAPCTADKTGITGLDPTACGAIRSGEAAILDIYGPTEAPKVIGRDRLPQPARDLLTECDGTTTCKFVAYDFESGDGKKSDTLTHVINTRQTTAHNAGVFVKDAESNPPVFSTIPGYSYDTIFSFGTGAFSYGTVIDERYCARECDARASTCGGFNYDFNTKLCILIKKDQDNNVYQNGRVAYIRDDNPTTAQGSDPPGTNLTGTGVWCGIQNVAACNADISNVINNSDVLSFTTSDLLSCSSCPAKTVSRVGTGSAATWAVTNEIETTTIARTKADTITKLQYSTTDTGPPDTTIVTPGKFYYLESYLPSLFARHTCLYLKAAPKEFEILDANKYFYMSGTLYTLPPGVYTYETIVVALNALETDGTFTFNGERVTWTGPYKVIQLPGPLGAIGFSSGQFGRTDPVTGLATIQGAMFALSGRGGGFFTYANAGQRGSSYKIAYGEIGEVHAMFSTPSDDISLTNRQANAPKKSYYGFETVAVDYVANGFLLLDPISGKYLVPSEALTNPTVKVLPQKYSAAYNALIFIITPSSYQVFLDEITALAPNEPFIIYRPTVLNDQKISINWSPQTTEPPFIFDPTTDPNDTSWFRIQQFPSQRTFDQYFPGTTTQRVENLVSSAGMAQYQSSQYSMGTRVDMGDAQERRTAFVDAATRDEAIADPAYPIISYYRTPTSKTFWTTSIYSSRVELADKVTGCADPDNPSAYIGGEYQKTVGRITFCDLCPAGKYSPADNPMATSCTPCAQGTYCPAGAGAEQTCAVGYYCPTPAQQIECPAGSYCPAGTAAPIACIAGDYCPAKSTAKVDCPAGEYCPGATATTGPWGANKITCPVGNYCPARTTAPIPCRDSTRPTISFYCPPGTRTLNECPAGKYCPNNGEALACTEGHYCPQGSGAEISCPGDSTYVPLGLKNINVISMLTQAQVLNQIFTQGSTCYACPGTLKANATKTGCICTGDLKWAAWTNECIPDCPIGQSANTAKTGCEACGDNMYTPVRGLDKCIPCATNFPGTTHKPDKSGCICNATITGGTLEWNSTWNRCRVVCNNDNVAYWSTCYPKVRTADPIAYQAPDATPEYGCPDGSENGGGKYAKDGICTKGADRKATTAGGRIYNYSCPRNWDKNGFTGRGQWDNQPSRNLSCKRSTIIRQYKCPTCWKVSYYKKGTGNECPTGFSGTDCTTLPADINALEANGVQEDLYSARCIWDGNSNPGCATCPMVPEGGYTGPTYDSAMSTAMKLKCVMNSAPATPDPWGADGASPQLDAQGNIMLPSLVSRALASQAPPPGNPDIKCPAGTYGASTGPSLTTGGDGSVSGATWTAGSGTMPGNCTPCRSGYYCGAGYDREYPCPAGAICPTPKEFYACTEGQICPAQSVVAGVCPEGFYCPSASTIAPITCPAGFYCPGGTVTPKPCNTGEYCPAQSIKNNPCGAGFYCPSPTEQLPCTAGNYCPTGSARQRPCEAGNYCPAGSKVATPCTIGNYCPAQSSAQAPCDAGYFCPDPATRTACPAGTYSAATGQTVPGACTTCPAGTTCPYSGPGTLFPRPNTVPITCALGYYCPAGTSTFDPCPLGSYCPTSAQAITCPAGYGCPVGSISYQLGANPPPQTLSVSGVESCRIVCARGTKVSGPRQPDDLPAFWSGAICISTNTPGMTCLDAPASPLSCNCQRSLGTGWIQAGNTPTLNPATTAVLASAPPAPAATTTTSVTLINGRPSAWGATIREFGTLVSQGPKSYTRDIRRTAVSTMAPSDVIKSPDNNKALVFQPDKRLAMWISSNGTWTKRWESPPAILANMYLDSEGYFYGPSADGEAEWGWRAEYQMGNPYRASKAPFTVSIANDATIHMFRSDGVEVNMETPFPTTAWVTTPVDCIPGPISYSESAQQTGCQTGLGMTSPSSIDDYGNLIPGRGECRYADGAVAGTQRDTTQDRPPKNGGRSCLAVGQNQISYNGGTIFASNTERCYPGACSPNLIM